ncbi:tail fiber domain-containing protein, partial [Bacteroidales bacterium OttesenSCG-928-M06]|nr:tail fiber domain-containing protein [Bacteroidales bacterium OttesenSCG-928-M06]
MKAQKTLILISFFFLSLSVYAQLTINEAGHATFGKGISIVDEYTGSDGYLFKVLRKNDNKIYLTRGGGNNGVCINKRGMLRLGRNLLNSENYQREEDTPLCIVADSDFAMEIFMEEEWTYGIKMMYNSPWNGLLSATCTTGGSPGLFISGFGSIYANGYYTSSDLSLKTNVQKIESPLSKIMQLRGVAYELKAEKEAQKSLASGKAFESMKKSNPALTSETFNRIQQEQSRLHIGVVAQEVEKIIPEAVRTREDGLKAVAYHELVGLLIEGIKEQQTTIDKLSREVAELKSSKVVLKSSGTTFSNDLTSTGNTLLSQCVLSQNTPNPFTGQTEIGYFLPTGIKNASICIFDMQGKLIFSLDASPGNNSVIVPGDRLQAGMYLYSLIADGQE